MVAELQDAEWIGKAVQAAHTLAAKIEDNSEAMQAAIRTVRSKIARLADVVAEIGNATLVGKLEELERPACSPTGRLPTVKTASS